MCYNIWFTVFLLSRGVIVVKTSEILDLFSFLYTFPGSDKILITSLSPTSVVWGSCMSTQAVNLLLFHFITHHIFFLPYPRPHPFFRLYGLVTCIRKASYLQEKVFLGEALWKHEEGGRHGALQVGHQCGTELTILTVHQHFHLHGKHMYTRT